jgi:predicted ATPase
MSLSGFDDSEMGHLVQSVVGSAADPGVDVLAYLHEQTSGNALFALQLVRHLWETKALAVAGDVLSFAGADIETRLSRSLLDVVWSRVHGLGERAAEVLAAAAVLGVEFADDVLVPMTDLPAADVEAALDAAIAAAMLVETGDARPRLRFVHALVAHALHSEIPPRRRRRLHSRAAQVLQRGGETPSVDVVVELARHAFLAGDLTAAQRWAVAAGEHAYQNLAPVEAARWYERALAYATERQVPDAVPAIRERATRASPPRRWRGRSAPGTCSSAPRWPTIVGSRPLARLTSHSSRCSMPPSQTSNWRLSRPEPGCSRCAPRSWCTLPSTTSAWRPRGRPSS